ncbi:FadD3 family acyl-CoA ligase [Dietzia cinnamea]|uniref:FadD3 family acyl-CoA ligase n=1 Tax=Dietzia cinnamea TaxID=321318 RepID=UPI0007BB0D19|nr:FadD3 family acyl-CoA ligase [Dietzia cinnamea]KZO59151.1 fatty acid--CoA ligase [Dietzia maris]MCT2062434.1 FadD3 family acyl-CoA ligase [Dietzia cinnamea]MCT2236978.1 FadD3 family acyl-CoA ligase [Dietzia cinnamea]MCT2301480.1 FadD3 family acyl-CoA ligase [Dietzia cinnamea]
MTTTVETTPVETSTVESTPAALRRAAELWPEREAIADVQPGQDTRWTWSQLLDEVRRFAAGLVARGVEPGDRVVIWAPNTRHWVVASLGVQFAGATMVPANTRYTGSETLEIIQRTNAVAAVAAGAFLGSERIIDLVDAAGATEVSASAEGPLAGATSLRTIVRIPLDAGDTVRAGAGGAGGVDVLDFDDLSALVTDDLLARADARADAVTGDDVADILFTSGTTGKSKGVVALHRQTVAGSRAWGSNNGLTDRDGYLIVNPFFHSFGYKAGFLACVLFGVTIVPLSVYSTTETMRLIRDEEITILTGAPTIFQTLLDDPARGDYDLSSLRVAVTGASVVPVVLIERMQSDLGLETVITAYGQTETMGFITTTRTGDDDVTVSTTCGRAYPGMEIRIGAHGEILTRGEMVMQGYLDDPGNTATTIDPDGWLHTGDVGEIDADGNLRITDRLKDMYINGGFNVYPAEIEQTLARLDGVVESAVIGVPDDRMGEVGKAFIVRREDSTLNEQEVLDFCREQLANFKRPRTVEFVESLPRNASGKVLKTELR